MSKKFLAVIIAIVVLAIGGYFLYTILLVEEEPAVVAVGTISKNLETKIFADPKFTSLRQFLVPLVEVKIKGKTNPFMQF